MFTSLITVGHVTVQIQYKTFSRFVFDKTKSCDDCDNTDYYTNLNPAVLKLMSQFGSELVIGLTFSNVDLDYRQMPRCNLQTIGYSLATNCDPLTDPMCCCKKSGTANEITSCVSRSSKVR